MKKTVLSLLTLSAVLVSCGPTKTYVALEEATTCASAALDTVSSPMAVATIAKNWSLTCADLMASNGELKGEEVAQFTELQMALQQKVTQKSDSLAQLLIQKMTLIQPSEPLTVK